VLFLPVQNGKTALMLASRRGYTDGVQLLQGQHQRQRQGVYLFSWHPCLYERSQNLVSISYTVMLMLMMMKDDAGQLHSDADDAGSDADDAG
jgi:hypothetical protein